MRSITVSSTLPLPAAIGGSATCSRDLGKHACHVRLSCPLFPLPRSPDRRPLARFLCVRPLLGLVERISQSLHRDALETQLRSLREPKHERCGALTGPHRGLIFPLSSYSARTFSPRSRRAHRASSGERRSTTSRRIGNPAAGTKHCDALAALRLLTPIALSPHTHSAASRRQLRTPRGDLGRRSPASRRIGNPAAAAQQEQSAATRPQATSSRSHRSPCTSPLGRNERITHRVESIIFRHREASGSQRQPRRKHNP